MGAALLKAMLADASGLQVNDLAMRRGELRLSVVHDAQNAGGGISRPHFDLGGYHGRRVADGSCDERRQSESGIGEGGLRLHSAVTKE